MISSIARRARDRQWESAADAEQEEQQDQAKRDAEQPE
jgi:hypothetical protein